MAGTCKYCNCTETTPCEGGCAWTTDAQDVCTLCEAAAETAKELTRILAITATDPTSLLHVGAPSFEALPLEQQATLVLTCRAMVDVIRAGVELAMADDAVEAGHELAQISAFLLEHCERDIQPEETVADVVIRLLTPHVGNRIVVPGGVSR